MSGKVDSEKGEKKSKEGKKEPKGAKEGKGNEKDASTKKKGEAGEKGGSKKEAGEGKGKSDKGEKGERGGKGGAKGGAKKSQKWTFLIYINILIAANFLDAFKKLTILYKICIWYKNL